MIIRTEGIVLKTYDYRETSKIVHFFTRDQGKVKGIMKGIRKDPKKFGSHVDPFTVNDTVYYRYNNSDLHLISQCDLKNFYFQIREEYKRNVAAHYMLELIQSVMPVEQANEKVYQLMLTFLDSLQGGKDIDKLVHILQIKTLTLSGFRPHIDSCVRCGKRVEGRVRFSMKMGGLVCYQCPTQETTFSLISKGTVASILHVESSPWEQCLRLGLTPKVKKELKFLLNNFLIFHLEKRLKSANYL